MRLYSLSHHPNKPCNILQFKNTTIMLDCGLDISSALCFLPLTLVHSSRLSNLPSWIPRESADTQLEGELKECSGRVFIDSSPEFSVPEAGIVDYSEVNVILISNYHCLLALPYITEGTGFKGVVYATEPTLHIGRQFMEEMVRYIERTPKIKKATKWKQQDILKLLPSPLCDGVKPSSWKQIYTMKEVNSSLAKVKVVGFAEKLDIFGALQVSAASSGYCLGSCNWIIQSAHEKIVYISGSSTLTTHPKPLEQAPLRNADILILGSLTQTPLANPDSMLGEFCLAVAHTLRNGGNVLVPCYTSGVTYDLFECLAGHLDSVGLVNSPLFLISPVAEYSLAYSNILAEWLSQGKQSKVYLPEEPFPHAQLVRNGRLKHFSGVHADDFSSEFRCPCVVFTGHPSLRFGDVVHFIELWGNSSANVVVFTEPDFPYLDALQPFQPLAMKAVWCPIDTSLNFGQANKLVRDLKPHTLVIPEVYTVPPLLHQHRSDLVIESECKTISYKRGDVKHLPLRRKYERIQLDPELAEELMPSEVRPGVSLATITGSLIVRDNKYYLKTLSEGSTDVLPPSKRKRPDDEVKFPTNYTWGSLDVQQFVQKLKKAGMTDVKMEKSPNGAIVHLLNEDVLIQVEEHSTHIICADSALRIHFRDILLQCLNKF